MDGNTTRMMRCPVGSVTLDDLARPTPGKVAPAMLGDRGLRERLVPADQWLIDNLDLGDHVCGHLEIIAGLPTRPETVPGAVMLVKV